MRHLLAIVADDDDVDENGRHTLLCVHESGVMGSVRAGEATAKGFGQARPVRLMARRAETRVNARRATGWRQAIRLRRCGEVHRAAGGAYVVWGSAALASSSVQGATYL